MPGDEKKTAPIAEASSGENRSDEKACTEAKKENGGIETTLKSEYEYLGNLKKVITLTILVELTAYLSAIQGLSIPVGLIYKFNEKIDQNPRDSTRGHASWQAQKRDQVLSQIDSLLVNQPENIAGEITCNVKELISEAKTVNSEKSNFEFGRKLKRNTTSIFKRQREVMKKIKQLRKN
eukprot:jgi/Bigna1/84635/fgenesh1_pg.185_\